MKNLLYLFLAVFIIVGIYEFTNANTSKNNSITGEIVLALDSEDIKVIHVKENHFMKKDVKIAYRITSSTIILNKFGEKLSPNNLEEGQKVQVWGGNFVLTSDPLKDIAKKIVVLSSK